MSNHTAVIWSISCAQLQQLVQSHEALFYYTLFIHYFQVNE